MVLLLHGIMLNTNDDDDDDDDDESLMNDVFRIRGVN